MSSLLEEPRSVVDDAPSRRLTSIPVLVALFTVLVGVAAGALYLQPQPPAEGSADVGFARDMSRHHAQAVAMAEVIRDRTDDPELRTLAADIALTQQAQIGMMSAWLDLWGVSQTTTGPRMAWMGTPTDGLMPGMATSEESRALATLPVEQAEAQFLRLMVAHHTAGVEMGKAGAALAERPEVVQLAQGIAAAQTSEIEYLQSLLAARGLPPAELPELPDHDLAADSHGAGGPSLRDTVLLGLVALGIVAFLWLLADNLVRRAGFAQQGPSGAAAVVAAAAVVSSAVHLALTPAHAAESVAYGLFFLASALLLALGAAVLLAGRPAFGALLTGVSALVLIVLYVTFRVVPAPGAGAPETVDAWGVVAVAAELAVVALAPYVARAARRPAPVVP